MWIALILGLTGSVGHCTGMCSGIVMLLHRSLGDRSTPSAWVQIHGGRLLSYAALGFLAGTVGQGLKTVASRFALIQGSLAILTAAIGLYFVLSLLGMIPSPERLFPALVTRWRNTFKQISNAQNPARMLLVGMTWGLLPCGLVMTALFTAAVSAAPLSGAFNMAVFGLATSPLLFSVKLISENIRFNGWPRYGAAFAMTMFSLQLGLRGMAAIGVVGHFMIGKVMLW